MIAEAFENAWVANTGVQPVDNDVSVDFYWSDEDKPRIDYDADCLDWSMDSDPIITKWRLNKPERILEDAFKGLETAYDSGLPKVVCNVPMPACKPAKQEGSNVLVAFNRMTGHSLTEDELNTLRILMDVFGEK